MTMIKKIIFFPVTSMEKLTKEQAREYSLALQKALPNCTITLWEEDGGDIGVSFWPEDVLADTDEEAICKIGYVVGHLAARMFPRT